ncbi:MAG: alpha/beta fold hydrolase [Devosiaceae bacterium]|nr:alpha/beta fold hydrolase [Devosiaceae bacterium]
MSRRTFPPDNYEPFSGLPIREIVGADGRQKLAVHIAGRLDDQRVPLICIADYCRNMADYRSFVPLFHHQLENDWPVILVDLAGHGRSASRKNPNHYSTTNDAKDLGTVCAALGIERAIFFGQGYGGRVIMSLGGQSAHLIAGSLLMDCAPVIHAPSLVRLRDNLTLISQMRGKKQFGTIAHQAFGKSYPGITDKELDQIISRTFFWSRSGRVKPLFDITLITRLASVKFDDLYQAQWSLFNMLSHAPLMLIRTQLSDQLTRTIFEKMGNLRTDAIEVVIAGQGSPALLEGSDEVGAISDFVRHASRHAGCDPIVAG